MPNSHWSWGEDKGDRTILVSGDTDTIYVLIWMGWDGAQIYELWEQKNPFLPDPSHCVREFTALDREDAKVKSLGIVTSL